MRVVRIAGKAPTDFDRLLAIGKDGDAVEAFLPMPDRAVADLFELGGGEAFVLGLDFLQAGNRGPRFFQPFEQARQARLDPVDVEAGQLQRAGHLRSRSWSRTHTTRPHWGFPP